jgi:mRNA interferase MazF
LILQDESYAGDLPLVLAVPLTGAASATRFQGTLSIEPTPENGLRQSSVALVFQLRAVDRQRIRERIGVVSEEVLQAVLSTLDRLIGRPTANEE